ncbi:DUF3046 domain-containing protein [Nocardioides jiangxiensis]|uniref:DUF3046 domain-containing protein n=1 Tax=Nocardioides jiangxiensis TaxID=3064524 RepID=A0ABT9AWW4_9ACTN|nr:DUF3046 domain-containing protein [Nocardioides sp. WY-20]MDO7866982.1 DUF3046 domain-containing protein [Nocardioides sp. WY-20]
MRHSEFWERMTAALRDEGYARYWAGSTVIGSLEGRTVDEALAAGESPKAVWRAVHAVLDLPERDR